MIVASRRELTIRHCEDDLFVSRQVKRRSQSLDAFLGLTGTILNNHHHLHTP